MNPTPDNPARILIVDDHAIVRYGMGVMLSGADDLSLCGEAENIDEALKAIHELKPDAAVIDIVLKDESGLDLIRKIRDEENKKQKTDDGEQRSAAAHIPQPTTHNSQSPSPLPILVMSMHNESTHAEKALRAGAQGYIMKEDADEVLVEALRAILSGKLHVSDGIHEKMLRSYIAGEEEPSQTGIESLTAREKEVFEGVALSSARRESLSSFGDDTMILEKLIQSPRHIEVQIMADNFGDVVHLFERDCSIQRRHQKVIEEAPALDLPPTLRKKMTDAAIAVAKAINYRGAGTVECLVDEQEQFYFMEMNTRLQVEHPVTEMITGLDLVAWQLNIAANQPLPCQQSEIQAKGHAVECRLYAEDPAHDFMPSIGQIRFLRAPCDAHVRIDTGVAEHSDISMYYDPMIAKIIAWGAQRDDAIQRACAALQQYQIGGVKTNRAFLLAILRHPEFLANTFTTHFFKRHCHRTTLEQYQPSCIFSSGY